MSVDLRKRIVDLSKKAAFAANRHGIEGQHAQVVLVLDISKSMHALYHSGMVQRVIGEKYWGTAGKRLAMSSSTGFGLSSPR